MYATTQAVWIAWTVSDATTAALTVPQLAVSSWGEGAAFNWTPWITQQEETAELRAERRRAEEGRRQRHRDMEAVRAAAAERAERLLVACLSSEQRDSFARVGVFDVRAGSGRVFRIRRGRVRNVVEMGTGRIYCCHPYDGVPDADTMLAQKLMIETQEDEFLRLANVS